jgi:hypothetical protein
MMRAIIISIALMLPCMGVAHADETKPGPNNDDTVQSPANAELNIAELPPIRSAVDPVTSVPSLAFAPGISAPSLDILAASLVVSEKGAAVRGVFAPFAFAGNAPRVIADTRVEIRGQSEFAKPWGLSLSTGYSSATTVLRTQLDEVTRENIETRCPTMVNAENEANFKKAVEELAAAVKALNPPEGNVTLEGPSVRIVAGRIYRLWLDIDGKGKDPRAKAAAAKVFEMNHLLFEKPTGECRFKEYTLERMKKAYSHGWAVRAEGSIDFFPYIEGPKVSPAEGEPAVAPMKHGVSGFGVGASAIWFPTRNSRFSATFSYSAKRATTKVDDPQRRVSILIETAQNIGLGDIDASGFQKGIAGGLQFGLQKCLEDGGCDDPVPLYDKSKTARTLMVAAFLDLRAAEKLQLRVGLPLTVYSFAAAPALSDGGLLAWSFAPTLSITTTQWVL